jgi:serine protease inhibitor
VPATIGRSVAFVSVPEEGVPNAGVTSVGLVANTTAPEPVEVVAPVPPLATDNVPVVPATIGRPVAFVSVPEEGVPKAGVTKVGLVANTTAPEPVEVVAPVPPLATDKRTCSTCNDR